MTLEKIRWGTRPSTENALPKFRNRAAVSNSKKGRFAGSAAGGVALEKKKTAKEVEMQALCGIDPVPWESFDIPVIHTIHVWSICIITCIFHRLNEV